CYSQTFFFFNYSVTPDIYTLSLHERSSDLGHSLVAQPEMAHLHQPLRRGHDPLRGDERGALSAHPPRASLVLLLALSLSQHHGGDRKSTRLNSSHVAISYAVFCLKKKKKDD